MPLEKGSSKVVIQRNTHTLIKEGYPADQAYAIANKMAGKTRKKKPSRKRTHKRVSSKR